MCPSVKTDQIVTNVTDLFNQNCCGLIKLNNRYGNILCIRKFILISFNFLIQIVVHYCLIAFLKHLFLSDGHHDFFVFVYVFLVT